MGSVVPQDPKRRGLDLWWAHAEALVGVVVLWWQFHDVGTGLASGKVVPHQRFWSYGLSRAVAGQQVGDITPPTAGLSAPLPTFRDASHLVDIPALL